MLVHSMGVSVDGFIADAFGWTVPHIELERTRILEGENGVTHMHYRVQQ